MFSVYYLFLIIVVWAVLLTGDRLFVKSMCGIAYLHGENTSLRSPISSQPTTSGKGALMIQN